MKPLINPYYWYRKGLQSSRFRFFVMVGTILYLLSPIDLVPEIIPFIGIVDDGALIALCLMELMFSSRHNTTHTINHNSSTRKQRIIDISDTRKN